MRLRRLSRPASMPMGALYTLHDENGTLELLPDPTPDEWLSDHSRIMTCSRAKLNDGSHPFGPLKGNFWAARVCTWWPHDWKGLLVTEGETAHPRCIYRCRRCGSQIHIALGYARPPATGRL